MLDDLPALWCSTHGGDLFEVVRGVTYAKPQASDRPDENRTAIYRAGNLQGGQILESDLVWVESGCVSQDQILRPGDLVVAMSSGSPEIVGKVAAYLGSPTPRSFGAFCGGIRPMSPAVAQWLRQFFQSKHYRQTVSDLAAGVNINNLKRDHLESLEIPLPPEAEQRRIVAKLDALQSRTRLARKSLAAIPALLDHYRQSVLAAAFRGELTAEWRASQAVRTPVDKALRSIETPPRPSRYGSRSDTIIAGDYALAVGIPEQELPAGWQWTPLVNIARLESGHTPSRQHPEWWGGDVPWICIPDARDHHGRTIMRTMENTNNLGLQNSAARLLPAGTVCLSRTASVGYVTVMGKPMATSQDFVNWVCTPIIDPHWLKYLLIAENQALFRFGKGSTHTTIYFPEVISFHVGLPPIEEQRLIAEILERQMRRISELTVIVDAGLANCARLDQSTLATAFRGELVPQDPADEPASILLDRIRAARAQAGDAPRTRRPRTPNPSPPPARAAEPTTPYRTTAADPYAILLTALRTQGSLTSADAQAATGLDAAGVRPLLQRLVAEGVAKVEGQKRGTRYVVVSHGGQPFHSVGSR